MPVAAHDLRAQLTSRMLDSWRGVGRVVRDLMEHPFTGNSVAWFARCPMPLTLCKLLEQILNFLGQRRFGGPRPAARSIGPMAAAIRFSGGCSSGNPNSHVSLSSIADPFTPHMC
jgi:hypothetical protein